MPPVKITISHGVTLKIQPAGVRSAHPMPRERALRILAAAKGNVLVMAQLRAALPTPLLVKTDDDVLAAIATSVANGQMVLRLAGVCTPDKKRFFDWLAEPLAAMATDLKTTQQMMLTLAVKEGGWNKGALDHNEPKNNPFGMNKINKQGQAAGNLDYATLDAAIKAWKARHGDAVSGITDPQAFVNVLLKRGYNSVNSTYGAEFIARFEDVGNAMDDCGINP